jgi:hypothetical protein
MIKVYYRKLYEQPMIVRWNAHQFTSFHKHGEPPLWALLRANSADQRDQYTLNAFPGIGLSLPSARDLYFDRCVHDPPTPWADLTEAERSTAQEQAGVFAGDNPATAYWYGGAPEAGDRFVVFYGVKLANAPEANAVLTPVIKVLTPVPLTTEEFVAQYCGGQVPNEPVVAGFEIGENQNAPGLDWGDEVP